VPETPERSKKFVKVEDINLDLGLVFGRAMVCTVGGEPYFDTDLQHIPSETMLKAAVDFASSAQHVTKDMHDSPSGAAVFMFPLTNQIAKAFGIEASWEGLMVAYKPEPAVLAKFVSGEYTGFSCGGSIVEWEDVA